MSTLGALGVGWRAVRQAKAESVRRHRPAALGLRMLGARVGEAFFSIAAAGCVTTAAWVVAFPLGLLTAGGALLFVEWRMSDET